MSINPSGGSAYVRTALNIVVVTFCVVEVGQSVQTDMVKLSEWYLAITILVNDGEDISDNVVSLDLVLLVVLRQV
jgi:hypothetical protein